MTLNFHVRHEVTPDRVVEVLQAIGRKKPFDHVTQFHRQVGRLRTLGLAVGIGEDIALTPAGNHLLYIDDAKPQLLPDLMHYLHRALWNEIEPMENAFSWVYRSFCDWLVEQGQVQLTHDWLEATVLRLWGEIGESSYFADSVDMATKEGTLSLSTDSLNGVLHWLRPLRPPVLAGDTFARRHFCPPELLLLALGDVALRTGGELNVDLLLTSTRRDLLCRICLLEPSALDRTLDWVLPLYPKTVEPGTRTGAYGRFVRLHKLPQLDDLIS